MVHAESPEVDLRVDTMQMPNAADATPTVRLSGALFLSGGALWYKGFAGTYTEVAGA